MNTFSRNKHRDLTFSDVFANLVLSNPLFEKSVIETYIYNNQHFIVYLKIIVYLFTKLFNNKFTM